MAKKTKKKAKKKAKKTPTTYFKPPTPAQGPKKTKRKKAAKKPKGKCFVLMPFRDPFNMYYNQIIEPAVVKAELQPVKADSLFLPVPIMGDIWAMIQEATVLLAVLTGKNANVFYELGLGHAVGKPVVLVSETMDDVPFDLQPLRVILYDKDHPKWGDKLRTNIIKTLQASLEEPREAVPPMFRKKVKSQAPEESELSLRLKAAERKLSSLESRGGLLSDHISGRRGPSLLDESESEFLESKILEEKILRYVGSDGCLLEDLRQKYDTKSKHNEFVRAFKSLEDSDIIYITSYHGIAGKSPTRVYRRR